MPQGTDAGASGLRVTEAAVDALVTWTASAGFTSPAREQAGCAVSSDSMKAVVQAAVAGAWFSSGTP
ncbi:hypothetical protein [Streptomyces huasconensis]|uniref:hypothetical protein n=1 Tax=Streptomyces huasconensis TaxID=1854574 RepID=UPI0036FA3D11